MLRLHIENTLDRKGIIMILSDLGIIVTGKTPSTKKPEFWNGNIPFVTPKDIQGTKHILSTERKITSFGLNSVKGAILPKGAICVSCIGNIGYVGKTITNCVSNQQINSIVPSENINSDYVFYLMKWLWPYFKNYEGQSTALSILNKSQFSKIEIPCHSRKQQDDIANILNNIDDRIELNNAINNNLEQQAKALYKDWFFDFSPFSIEGNLPDGWHLGTVGDIIQLHDSKRVPLSGSERDKMEKIYPYYGATSLMDYVDNYLFDGIYLLLGEDGTVVDSLGFPILQYVYGQFWVNNHAHIITGKEGFSVEELYLFFSLTNIKSIVTGAVQQKVSQQNLKKVPAIIPSKEALSAFDDLIQPVFAQIRNLRDENAHLADLRDTLLPRLMSGELDVSNIEI